MKNLEELKKENQKSRIESKMLSKLISNMAEITGDSSFKILAEVSFIKDKANILSTPNNIQKANSKKIIIFLQQINKLMDDFIKEMNINE